MVKTTYALGSRVMTDLGIGVIIGRSLGDEPHYSARLFDGTIVHSVAPIGNPNAATIQTIELLDPDTDDNIRLIEVMPHGMVELLVWKHGQMPA